MIKIVVLSLTVTDMYTGTLLYERMMDWDRFAVSGNHIEDCRVWGGREAHALAKKYKPKYPWASSNVNCHWEQRAGAKA